MKIVYIASPYSGEVEKNVERAREYCRFALGMGVIPIAPHLLFPQFMDDNDPAEREQGMHFACVILEKLCDELWVMGTHLSDGIVKEMVYAKNHGIPVRFFDDGAEVIMQ